MNETVSYYLQGMASGLVLMLALGPSFFLLVSIGLQRRFQKALAFAIGILLSDTTLILLVVFGFSKLFSSDLFKQGFSLIAGIVVLIMGVIYLRKREVYKQVEVKQEANSIVYMLKGFAINFINPFTFMIWFGIYGMLHIQEAVPTVDMWSFFLGVMTVIFTTDLLKAYLAKLLGKWMTEKTIRRIHILLGLIFIALSLRLFYHFASMALA